MEPRSGRRGPVTSIGLPLQEPPDPAVPPLGGRWRGRGRTGLVRTPWCPDERLHR